MTLHRTPVHHTALVMARDGRVEWQTGKTVGNGWFTIAGGEFPPPELVVALWELLREKLIVKRGPDVALTDAGKARLAEWDATRTAVR